MAQARIEIIQILGKTAQNIEQSSAYQWGHMGSCNCGFLAQQISKLGKAEIHTRAMQGHGDWSEQLNDYCPTSGLAMDELISAMLTFGFDIDDLKHLERLSDPKILALIPEAERNVRHNVKADVLRYFHAWITLQENEIVDQITLPGLPLAQTIL
jgi:hypothetical protein